MHLPGPGLSRLAVATAVLTVILMAVGALATGDVLNGRYHVYLALATGGLAVMLLIGLVPANVPAWLRATGWIAVALFALDSGIMAWTPLPPVEATLAIPHAIAGALFLATTVVIAFYMPQDWINGPELVDMTPWPLLQTMALATPLVVIVQIALGAAYRHKVFGVMPHMAGAMVATLLLLVLAVQLLQHFPTHPTLRPVAIAAMSVLLLQVTLGISAFVMRLLDFDTMPAFVWIAAAHVCLGALTLASSLVLCIEVRRTGLASSGRS